MGSSLSTPLSLQLFNPGFLISWATKQSLLLHLSYCLHNYYSYTACCPLSPFSSALSVCFTLLLCMCCKHWVLEAYHHQLGVLVSTARTVSSYMYKNLYMRTSDSLLYIVLKHKFHNIYLYWVLSYCVGSVRLAYYSCAVNIRIQKRCATSTNCHTCVQGAGPKGWGWHRPAPKDVLNKWAWPSVYRVLFAYSRWRRISTFDNSDFIEVSVMVSQC